MSGEDAAYPSLSTGRVLAWQYDADIRRDPQFDVADGYRYVGKLLKH